MSVHASSGPADQAPQRTVGLYARVSTDDKHQRPEVQLHPLRAYAESRGWAVVEYVDEGVSGAKTTRPELDRMMADIDRGVISAVVVWKFDRFARSVQHLLTTLDRLREKNVDFVSVTESIDTSTPTGRFVFTLIAAMAEFEREMLRERVRAGMAEARRRGKQIGRKQRNIDLRPVNAMLGTGLSVEEVARILNLPSATLRRHLKRAKAAAETPPVG